ncbi:MAG TPA: hypothetical protein PLE74_01450 [Candidatus Cloacimonadota bacterium]|nr:hypothetical protein [Candidatus Cloacimonadota bacterium]HPT70930.1 hypothetical protein [Candidatus Cloacimonadota bacterium]
MRYKSCLLILSSVLFGLSLWAYPIYHFESADFKGLDRSNAKSASHKFALLGEISKKEYDETTSNMFEFPTPHAFNGFLYKCYNPYYLKCTDFAGRVLWKTSTLYAFENDDTWGDQAESPLPNVEYVVSCINETKDGLLLYDIEHKRYVLKKDTGEEITFPQEIGNYRNLSNIIGNLGDNFLFGQYGEKLNFEIAVVSFDGVIRFLYKTDTRMIQPSCIEITPTQKYIVISYDKTERIRRLFLLSTKERMYKDFSDFDPGNGIGFYKNAPDFSLLRTEWKTNKCILDNSSGNIVAGFDYDCIDMTQVDSTLIAIIGNGPFVVVFDVLSGKLIQDFTDHSNAISLRNTKILGVQISKDAKEIRYAVKKADKAVQYLEYKMKE